MNPAEGEVEDVRARLSRPHLAGNVELKGVSYTFPGANSPILNNLSLKIPAGKRWQSWAGWDRANPLCRG